MKARPTHPRPRGFAVIPPERQRQIASAGGKAAHAAGTAHEFTSEEAKIAGKKGGKALSANREHMSRIGKIGGSRSKGRKKPPPPPPPPSYSVD